MRLVSYLSVPGRHFLFTYNRIMFETSSNLTMRDQNGTDKVALFSLLLNWNMLARSSAASISDNDHQANTTWKCIDPVTSLIS